MVISLEVFKAAVRLLKENTLEEVLQTLGAVRNHLDALQQKYTVQTDNLSRSVIYYKKYKNQMEWRKVLIDANELQTWIPLLRQHKEANAFQDVKVATVQKIVHAKNEMDHLDLSLGELKLRLQEFARNARATQNEMKTTNTQILVLDAAVDIFSFFATLNYDPKEIAEFEYEKYYEQYRRAGEGNG